MSFINFNVYCILFKVGVYDEANIYYLFFKGKLREMGEIAVNMSHS